VGEATAARYPSFSLDGSIGLEALTLGALTGGHAATWSLLAGIAAPIFDAGRIRRQIEIQSALQEQALVSYEATVLTALEDVENALVALASSRQRQDALTGAAEAARNAALLARDRYAAGLIDFQTVLDTERSVLSIEDSLATTQAEGASALVQLYKALGGGWSPGTSDGGLAAGSSGNAT
jgi:outer membrane protein TolC